MSFEYKLSDEEMYWLICGLHAGLKLRDLTVPEIDTSLVLQPIGVGGETTIGLMIPEIKYDGSTNNFLIPVSVHDVNINYSGFSINIKWDSNRLRLDKVLAGDFGTVSNGSEQSDIRYTYSNGLFQARGIRDHNVRFSEPIILFYLQVTVLDEVTKAKPIHLKLQDRSFTDLNYCTLLTWVEVEADKYYNYYITPLANISGSIISDNLNDDSSNNKDIIGDNKDILAAPSPSGVYVGEAHTAPGEQGVVPIYANSNINDDFPYSGVHCVIVVEDNINMFSYIKVVDTGGFSVTVNKTILDNGYIQLDILATRPSALIDSITFCYIEYKIIGVEDSYRIPLNNILSELIN